MHRIAAWAFALMFPLLPVLASAETIQGRVVSIADGDTLTILAAGNIQHRIRLAGIDAPEKRQRFGERSRQHLGYLAHGKEAMALCTTIDRYRRRVCKVMVQPPDCPTCDKTLDAGLAQVAVGAAWWYREYAKEQSAEDRARYSVAEQDARAQDLGLWRHKDLVPPWEWRRIQRKQH